LRCIWNRLQPRLAAVDRDEKKPLELAYVRGVVVAHERVDEIEAHPVVEPCASPMRPCRPGVPEFG